MNRPSYREGRYLFLFHGIAAGSGQHHRRYRWDFHAAADHSNRLRPSLFSIHAHMPAACRQGNGLAGVIGIERAEDICIPGSLSAEAEPDGALDFLLRKAHGLQHVAPAFFMILKGMKLVKMGL